MSLLPATPRRASSPDNKSNPIFTKLPGEIRNRVYHYLYQPPQLPARSDEPGWPRIRWNPLALSYTCKIAYKETRWLAVKYILSRVMCRALHWGRDFYFLFQQIPPEFRYIIQELTLQLPPLPLIHSFPLSCECGCPYLRFNLLARDLRQQWETLLSPRVKLLIHIPPPQHHAPSGLPRWNRAILEKCDRHAAEYLGVDDPRSCLLDLDAVLFHIMFTFVTRLWRRPDPGDWPRSLHLRLPEPLTLLEYPLAHEGFRKQKYGNFFVGPTADGGEVEISARGVIPRKRGRPGRIRDIVRL
ncbi:hypothetical protein M011DRAFT_482089 [Sporormia fimetaria CBS 119925]|uniref:F-box domain-containing protein n=1 Tax=Sporormia fimetaria CBS 119925 TaxID=1340428 RepID=A0A6A6UUZ5_9PLEO|nr:hypothetical protein M011DRAFT_482089 [Sporormia fimetaria CBS 119925]